LGCSPYEALLDQFQRGTKKSEIDTLFADLGEFLPGFMAEALEHQRSRGAALPLKGPFATEAQRELGLKLMRAVGFDFERGRLDVSLHPFCGGSTDDVRITTRYDENDFAQALMGVMHETGHALYEQGRPAAWKHQPVGATSDLAIHESQSLLVEMQVARGLSFLKFAAPMIREALKAEGPEWNAENLQRVFSHVEPGFIRVDADEVTYPAHVILRYELEQAMIAGDLALKDLPAAWNERMKKLLGLEVPNDRLGCLQDIHWPGGGWGYFPSYTMGAITAAQLFEAATKAPA
jgi:carboxypeptidase Taq